MSGMTLSSTDMYTVSLLLCLFFKKSDPDPGPFQNNLFHNHGTQSQSYMGSKVGDVIPGAARLISETAQRVHTIGQKQKNDQHLRRVQALLSGRQAKGLTSGSLPASPSILNCPIFYFYLTPNADQLLFSYSPFFLY